MGCDIHFFVEKYSTERNSSGPCGKQGARDETIEALLEDVHLEPQWISADEWEADEEDDEVYWSVKRDKRFYAGRNYALFAILADVRNGGIEYLAEPRGVPDDASDAYDFVANVQDEGDAHSHSYFTLEELQDVDWASYPDNYDLKSFMATIQKMSELDPDPTKVRCCFYFDN